MKKRPKFRRKGGQHARCQRGKFRKGAVRHGKAGRGVGQPGNGEGAQSKGGCGVPKEKLWGSLSAIVREKFVSEGKRRKSRKKKKGKSKTSLFFPSPTIRAGERITPRGRAGSRKKSGGKRKVKESRGGGKLKRGKFLKPAKNYRHAERHLL